MKTKEPKPAAMGCETIQNRSAKLHQPLAVILIRHAQSLWNQQNRFTGWADPALTQAGIDEAIAAAQRLQLHGFEFDRAYSSRLQRAIQTRDLILQHTQQQHLEQHQDWRLNERHYGQLQGRNKARAAEQVGEQQVWRWRRSYRELAEPLTLEDPQHPANDPMYEDLDPSRLPAVENLAMTRERVSEFWQQRIVPELLLQQRILISAHGNTLRALLMQLDNMSVEQVESFEIPTATPIVYYFDAQARPLSWHYLPEHELERKPA